MCKIGILEQLIFKFVYTKLITNLVYTPLRIIPFRLTREVDHKVRILLEDLTIIPQDRLNQSDKIVSQYFSSEKIVN